MIEIKSPRGRIPEKKERQRELDTERHTAMARQPKRDERKKEKRGREMERMRVCFNPCSAGISIAGLSPVLPSSALFHVHNYSVLSIISETVLLGRRKITDLSTSANRININIALFIYSRFTPNI